MRSYVDMHCDTLMKAWAMDCEDIYTMEGTMLDVERLCRGGCKAQFFAMFLESIDRKEELGEAFPEDDAYVEECCRIFRNTIERHGDVLAPAGSYEDYKRNAENGKISGILTVEDGRLLDGRMEKLEDLYQKGVRLISLTWNHKNCLGSPNSRDAAVMAQGLTSFGKDVVCRMNELGMLVDVSHLSDGGFWDVVKLSEKPFVASHSNCRALNPHTRSMTDEMIRALAEKGGVMGVNFAPGFLTRDTGSRVSRISDLVKHLRHMIDVGGIGCAAIGTDFDGIGGELEIDSADKMPLLFDALEKAGFTAAQIDALAEKNVERVMKDAMF